MSDLPMLRRGDAGYEAARRDAVANRRCPGRMPAAVVRARDERDVVDAVRAAISHGWQIGVRSGGHSWAGSHLRDGGLLLDLSEMTAVSLDDESRTATIEPGVRGAAFTEQLAPQGLFFPTGHCVGPGLGGFLLQGGFGWNSRVLGPACMSVTGIDVVTAAGDLIYASAEEHPDLFWAARGSGTGFFGVVTRFYLRLHTRPRAQYSSAYLFSTDHLNELMRWVHQVGADVPPTIEMMVFMRRDLMGVPGPGLQLLAPVLADSEEQARADLAFLKECPVLDHALVREAFVATDVRELVQHSAAFYPDGWRYSVDNMWTHADVEDLLPGYRRIVETLPDAPSHAMWMNWHPQTGPSRPDMAYSLEDDVYVGLYAVWEQPAADARFVDWATDRMRELEPLASGVQLADENLGRRPARFVTDENLRRLDEIRARYDPSGTFHSWMGRPAEV